MSIDEAASVLKFDDRDVSFVSDNDGEIHSAKLLGIQEIGKKIYGSIWQDGMDPGTHTFVLLERLEGA